MIPAPSDERATSPAIGVALLFVIAVLVAGAVGVGVFLNDETVTAGVQIAASNGEATVLWTEAGNAEYIEVTTSNSLGNATIEEVEGTVELPRDVGRSGETMLIVRAVNNETDRVIEEQEVELE
ncbi:archaellin/type IV pilin N-terminal domain-containing protein [Halobacterium jilantaiense]|uniref:Flagellin (Archaellin), FlaG/FlaF family n=1 Tax=Halobacterium jilantaiense TaxID=355548 RepID=A0A1I0PYH6_9EURY|nr:archaellin/type IV pilin N-terminal domain-containing protein [Halobacterium jilantaiense]SEW19477.1 flagellin (archaellin), FlaG/FlaF family [Halobacterium jilantaiense]